MRKKLLIFPFGGNGREALLSVFAMNKIKKVWDVAGFVDDDRSLHGNKSCGVRVIGAKEIFKKYPNAYILAVPGNPNNYLARKGIIESLKIGKSRFATVIDPSSVVSPDAVIGCNTVIMSGVFIGPGVEIGNHCVILPNTVISHDSVIDDWCLIGSNAAISGAVKIGPMSYIGSGAKIRGGISVGRGSLVGLGSVVIDDIKNGVVAAGNPARILRKAKI